MTYTWPVRRWNGWLGSGLILAGVLSATAGCGGGGNEPVTAKSKGYQVGEAEPSEGGAGPARAGTDESKGAPTGGQAATGGQTGSTGEPTAGRSTKPSPRPPVDVADDGTGTAGGARGGTRPAPAGKLGDIPDSGSPEELGAYLEKLAQSGPPGRNDRERMENQRSWIDSLLTVCDRLLASKANEKLRLRAARTKRDVLIQMVQQRVPETDKQMVAYCDSLINDPSPALVRLGRITQLHLQLAMLVTGAKPEPEEVMNSLSTLLEDPEKDDELFEAVVQTAGALQQTGHDAAALEAFRAIGAAFTETKNARVAAMLGQIKEMTQLLEVGLDAKCAAVLKDEPQAEETLLAAAKSLLENKPGALTLNKLAETARDLEHGRKDELTDQLYAALGEAYKDNADAEVADQVNKLIQRRQRRAALIGKPLDIVGKQLDGDEFDWKSYQGKVILVDFWATWCGPCLAELPNIKRNYERYHDQGFEVVGINLDRDRKSVDTFFATQSLPWTTVMGADGLAETCGVESIPFVMLVGRDGRVIDLHVRGEILGQRLAKLFDGGSEAPDKVPAKPDAAPPGKPAGEQSFWRPLRPSHELGLAAVNSYVVQRESPPPTPGNARPAGSPAVPNKTRPAAAPAPRTARAKTKDPTAKGADDPEVTKVAASEAKLPEGNPYAPSPSLTPAQLAEFIQKMQDKPKSIQGRPGFADAIVLAADRILAANADEKTQLIAIQAKLETLHKKASDGDPDADEQLVAFVNSLQSDQRPQVTRNVKFLQLERRVIDADNLPTDQIPALLAEVKEYCTQQKLDARHVRLASNTVRVINRLAEGDEREKYFAEFGGMFAKSSDKELSRYGKKLAKSPEKKESELVGKPLELVGATVDGQPLNWDGYRGKVVIVDFWATWCGPCIRELPNVKAIYEKNKARGFDIVGISLDADLDALAEFLEKNPIPWATVAGDGTQALATKYGVRGIPTMMLVDKDGKVVAVSHRVEELAPELEKLLGK